MAGNLLAGTAVLTVDGQSYAVVGKFGYRTATVARSSLVGMDTVHGYKEKPIVGQIKATLRDTGGLSVASLNQMIGVTVVADLANGKTIVGSNMWSVSTDGEEVDSEEATVDVVWEGPDVSEN